MRTTITVNDIRNLISKIGTQGKTAFTSSKTSPTVFVEYVKELAEYFELVFMRLEKVEDKQKSYKDLAADVKKLRHDLDRATVALNKVVDRVNRKD